MDTTLIEDMKKRKEMETRKVNYVQCVRDCEEEQKENPDKTIDNHGKCVLRCSKRFLPLCYDSCLTHTYPGKCFACIKEKLKEGGEDTRQIHTAFSQCCEQEVRDTRAGMIAGLVIGVVGFFITVAALIDAILKAKKANHRAKVAEEELFEIKRDLEDFRAAYPGIEPLLKNNSK